MKPSPRTCRLPRKALEYGEEVLRRIRANKDLPNVSERTRRALAKKWFEQPGTIYKQYVAFRPVLYVSAWLVSNPEAAKYVRISWVDEKGRRCHRGMSKAEFERWFIPKK